MPPRTPLVPERSDFLEGDAPAAAKVEAFLARALEATGSDAPSTAGALVPWICDALLSNHSVKAYGRDLMDFVRHMQAQGVDPLNVTADHVKCYKRALLEAGLKPATVARRLSVLRGTHQQLAAKGLIPWETAQDIQARGPGRILNISPGEDHCFLLRCYRNPRQAAVGVPGHACAQLGEVQARLRAGDRPHRDLTGIDDPAYDRARAAESPGRGVETDPLAFSSDVGHGSCSENHD